VHQGPDLLVDGMFLGNLPVAEVDLVARCRKIAVNLVPVVDELAVARGARTSRLRTLVARFRPGVAERPPVILDLMMRAVLLASVSQAKRAASEVELYVEPAIGRYGFFDLRAWDRIVEAGYRATKDAVAALRRRDPGFPA
jgi:predicted acylesterase/phospholipase RssA